MSVIIIRTILLYAIITFGLRIMGKRQLGELQPSEFVITILISNIATLPIEDTNIPFLVGVIPILTLICFEVFTSSLSLKFKSFRTIISGTPKIIISNGVINQAEMKNLRLSVDDLMGQLRVSEIFDVRDVEFAMVETTGKLSIYKKYESQNTTAQMLKLSPEKGETSPPVIIVSDGKVNSQGLKYCNISNEWLNKTLKENKCKQNEIFLMTCDRVLDYHIITKGDKKSKG